MKRLMIAAMLLGSASAFAQPPQNPQGQPPQGQPDPGSQPTQQPDPAPTPPADPMPPESGTNTMQPVPPSPQPGETAPPMEQAAPMQQAAPPAAASPQQQYTYGTIPPPRPADENYPRCSRTVTDNCTQGGPR